MPLFDSAWAQLGAVGVVILFVVAILTGRLVPLSTVRRELAAADKRANDYQEIAALEREARKIDAAKADEILALLKAMNVRSAREAA